MKIKKPTANFAKLLIASGLFVYTSGCGTLPKKAPDNPDEHMAAMPEAADEGLPEALTHFSMGILDDIPGAM